MSTRKSEVAALPAKPRGAMALPEKLDHAANTALDRVQELLDREIDEADTKALSLQMSAALQVVGYKIRIDTERMREQGRDVGSYDAMFGAFDAPPGKTIEAEEDKK